MKKWLDEILYVCPSINHFYIWTKSQNLNSGY